DNNTLCLLTVTPTNHLFERFSWLPPHPLQYNFEVLAGLPFGQVSVDPYDLVTHTQPSAIGWPIGQGGLSNIEARGIFAKLEHDTDPAKLLREFFAHPLGDLRGEKLGVGITPLTKHV